MEGTETVSVCPDVVVRGTWPLTRSGRISFSVLPSNKTNVNTITVMSNDARTWRVRYVCSVFRGAKLRLH